MSSKPKANRGPSAGPDNRRSLVAAAREVFSETGFLAPLSSVARRAGVGQGSLYRHFPDRISLAVAVFDDNIVRLETLAAEPGTTLDDLFDRLTEQAIGSAALIDMITSNRHDPRAEHLGTRVVAVVDAMLARDRERGLVRGHVTADDVMLSVTMLAVVLSRTDPGDRAAIAVRARALFRSAFDG